MRQPSTRNQSTVRTLTPRKLRLSKFVTDLFIFRKLSWRSDLLEHGMKTCKTCVGRQIWSLSRSSRQKNAKTGVTVIADCELYCFCVSQKCHMLSFVLSHLCIVPLNARLYTENACCVHASSSFLVKAIVSASTVVPYLDL